MTLDRWKAQAAALKADTYALYLAYQDPRVPWSAKLVTALVVAYALSPIDLIPDFIPVLGYLDDLLLVPLGIALAIRLIPPPCSRNTGRRPRNASRRTRRAAGPAPRLVGVWLIALLWISSTLWSLLL